MYSYADDVEYFAVLEEPVEEKKGRRALETFWFSIYAKISIILDNGQSP